MIFDVFKFAWTFGWAFLIAQTHVSVVHMQNLLVKKLETTSTARRVSLSRLISWRQGLAMNKNKVGFLCLPKLGRIWISIFYSAVLFCFQWGWKHENDVQYIFNIQTNDTGSWSWDLRLSQHVDNHTVLLKVPHDQRFILQHGTFWSS